MLENWRKQVDAGCCSRPDAHPPQHTISVGCDRLQSARDLLFDASEMDQQVASGRGRLCVPANPLNESGSKALLKLPNLKAHGWLADARTLGRRREAPKLDHIRQGLKLVEVEVLCQSFPYC